MSNKDNLIQGLSFGNEACFYYSDTVYTGQNDWCSPLYYFNRNV